jgi:hypothetical protein
MEKEPAIGVLLAKEFTKELDCGNSAALGTRMELEIHAGWGIGTGLDAIGTGLDSHGSDTKCNGICCTEKGSVPRCATYLLPYMSRSASTADESGQSQQVRMLFGRRKARALP